jgi:hypothetical protein
MLQKVIMEQEAGFIRLPSSPILKPYNTHLGIEKIEKENLEPYGSQELTQVLEH